MSGALFPRRLLGISRQSVFFALALAALLACAARYTTTDLFAVWLGDPDEGVYLVVARLLNHGHTYSEFFFDQFWLFPQILTFAFRLFGDSLVTGRYVVVAFSMLGLGAATLLARQLGARWFALLAVPFGITNQYYLTQSRTAMTDVPGIAIMLCAVVAAIAFASSRRRFFLILCTIAFTASLLIKPLSVGFAVPIAYALISARLSRNQGRKQIDWRALLLDGTIFAATALLTAFPFVNLFDLRGEFERTVVFHWDEQTWYVSVHGPRWRGLVSFVGENRMWLGLCAVGIFSAARRKFGIVLALVIGEILSALVLLQFPPWWHHYTLLAPFLTTFAAIGVAAGIFELVKIFKQVRASAHHEPWLRRSFDLSAARTRSSFAALGILFLLGAGVWLHDLPKLGTYNHNVFAERAPDAQPLISYLKRYTDPGDYIISDRPIVVYLAGCVFPPSAVNAQYETTFHFSNMGKERMRESILKYPVKAIVVTGEYRTNPELMQWIRGNFPLLESVGGKSNVLLAGIYSKGIGDTPAASEEQDEDTPPPALD